MNVLQASTLLLVIASTWNSAKAIKQERLGNFSIGAAADVAVLRLDTGSFGSVDHHGARLEGTERLQCELTLRGGKVAGRLPRAG